MEASRVVSSLLRRQTLSVNANDDENVGSARETPSSLSGLVSTLVPSLILAVAFVAVFLILRAKFPRQYAPRTYMGALRKEERTPALPKSMFGWLKSLNQLPDTYVLQHNSLDAFFLLRYLKICIIITFFGCLLTWPILWPVYATGGAGQPQLSMITFGNIGSGNLQYRYYAPALITWVFIGFVFFTVTREMIFYINLRQAYLLSPIYAQRISSRTVLFQGVPAEYANEQKIRMMFGDKLKNVWIASNTKKLEDWVDERTKAAMKLEAAETKLIKMANKARVKSEQKDGHREATTEDIELGGESGSAAARYVSPKQRPTHRLKPLVGKKVDTINWAREEIARLNPLIEKEQNVYRSGEAEPMNGVFVEFYNQTEAQAAYQMVAHHQPLHMSERVIGAQPGEIIWSNLAITWRTRSVRNIISIAVVVVTIIFWSFPVAVVGAISNINFLVSVAPFLSFINNCPPAILGVITNLLPSVMLAVLMSLLPPFLRLMAKFSGKPTLSLIELRCHESYFWFQVIQVFLVTTLTSAASSAVPEIINNPTSVTNLLAQNLPASSNFYISYIILQGLTFASGALLQISGLILFKVLGKLLDSTPRKMYNRWLNLSSLGWGTIFPVIELLTVISITYSAIAPLVMGFATIGLFLFYFAYRYNLLFVNTSEVDTRGLVYAKALKHTLVGCYLSVVCLIGLFGIQAGGPGKGPLVLMIILLVVMILYHISLNSAIEPLLLYLPRSLEAEEEALLHADREMSAPTIDEFNSEKNGKLAATTQTSRSNRLSTNNRNNGKPPSIIQKFLRPDIYASYKVMRLLVLHDSIEINYPTEVERDAYQPPAVTNVSPLLWIPRDSMGISRQECAHTNKVTPMTDDGAYLDDKGNVVWDEEGTDGRPPIYEEKYYY